MCILAAGIGSRITSFGGRVHKALLPLGDTAVISRIIAQFPADAEFVIAVGHNSEDLCDYVRVAHPERSVWFVPVDRYSGTGGPGYAVWCCREYLEEPFYLTACDTLLTGALPALDRNTVVACRIKDPALWCSLELDSSQLVRGIHYKSPAGGPYAFVGFAAIRDYEAFFAALAPLEPLTEEIQVDGGLKALIPLELGAALVDDWIDTGDDESYERASERFPSMLMSPDKVSDLTYRLGDRIIKYFPDGPLARDRFERGLRNDAFATPLTWNGRVFSYRYVHGSALSRTDNAMWYARTLDWLQSDFWRTLPVSSLLFYERCQHFYRDKTLSRLGRYRRGFAPGSEVETVNINGRPCRSVARALDDLPNDFWTGGLPSTFHGDLHDANIIIAEDRFKLIDWRSDFAGDLYVGDRYYDLAKFLHTLDLSVSTMDRSAYALEVADHGILITHEGDAVRTEARDIFWNFVSSHGYDRDRIAIINGLIFVNMAPLYAPRMADYLYHLGRLRLENAIISAAGWPSRPL